MFKQEDDFLPSSCQTGDLERANFDKFTLINPRLRAAFTEGYGFLFGGSIQILDWDPFDVNILINKPNDQPTTVTVAVYTQVFSISKMLRDLFKIDIATIEVLGNAEIRNLGFSISTGDVETPLTVLDIGSEDIFDIPYRKGLKVSFWKTIFVCNTTYCLHFIIDRVARFWSTCTGMQHKSWHTQWQYCTKFKRALENAVL